MLFACRFRHSFELAKKNRFDEAIKELELLATATREIMEIERMKDLISVLKYDKDISQIEMNSPDYIARNSLLLEQYGNTVNRHVGYDFMPINARVEFILRRYIKYAYYLIDSGKYDEASEVIKLLREVTNKIMPKLDSHPAHWYYRSLLERFESLEGLINAESYLRKEGVKDFKTERSGIGPAKDRVQELKTLYEEYIGRYSSRWLLTQERQRFEQLY